MKKLIFAAIVLLIAGLACLLLIRAENSQPMPSWKKLPDGSSVRILTVTYGTNHVIGSKLGKTAARLPSFAQEILTFLFGERATSFQSFVTPTPEMVVWFERGTNGMTSFATGAYQEVMLGDTNGFVSGENEYLGMPLVFPAVSGVPPPAFTEHFGFKSFPRRSKELSLNFFYHDAQGKVRFATNISFLNPEFRKYPVWQAEKLPATKRAGDVEVTLLKLETGHDNSMSIKAGRNGMDEVTFGTNRTDGNNYTAVYIETKPLGNTNEVWEQAGLELSDATGNLETSFSTSWSEGHVGFSFSPSLWPDEPAWKLKLAIKKTAGFKPDDFFVFKNVPLGELNKTNMVAWSTNFDGISVTLQSISRKPPAGDNWSSGQLSSIKLSHPNLPAGTMLNFVNAVYNTGTTNQPVSSSTSDRERTYSFKEFPTNAQTADFVFSLQRVRTVEFIVKPELPKPEVEAKKKKKK